MTKTIEKPDAPSDTGRRSFLKGLAGAAGAAAVTAVPASKAAQPKSIPLDVIKVEPAQVTPVGGELDPLERMREELVRALEKPVNERRWVMVIDLRKCVGCNSCTIACVAENHLPPGVVYRPVIHEEVGTFPNVTERFLPRPCMQCDNPPCVPVCPVNATWKRDDGIVEIDYDKCIGCRYCITACPYNARVFDKGFVYNDVPPEPVASAALVGTDAAEQYEVAPAFEYGEPRSRQEGQSPIGNARKCHFCLHRLEKGMLPACTTTCIGRATYFGDANDPDSLVSELIASPNVMRLKEELGAEPKVYYLQ